MKTVADVLKEAKELLSEDKGRQLRPVVRRICGLDRDLLDMCNHALAKCGLSDNELIDRAIAIASGTAEKPLGEVLSSLRAMTVTIEPLGESSRASAHCPNRLTLGSSEADTPEVAIRALAEKVRK